MFNSGALGALTHIDEVNLAKFTLGRISLGPFDQRGCLIKNPKADWSNGLGQSLPGWEYLFHSGISLIEAIRSRLLYPDKSSTTLCHFLIRPDASDNLDRAGCLSHRMVHRWRKSDVPFVVQLLARLPKPVGQILAKSEREVRGRLHNQPRLYGHRKTSQITFRDGRASPPKTPHAASRLI